MYRELDNFVVTSEIKLDYFADIVNYLKENERPILDFFGLSKLPKKYQIKILEYPAFRAFIVKKYGLIQDYVRGDTDVKSSTIVILTLEDQLKYTSHKDTNLEEMLEMIMHEFIHACNNEVSKITRENIWLREGLATNLAHQDYEIVDLRPCDFARLKKDFNGYGHGSYGFAYTIVNYILNNYSKPEINRLLTDNDYLVNRADDIFLEATTWVLNNKKER